MLDHEINGPVEIDDQDIAGAVDAGTDLLVEGKNKSGEAAAEIGGDVDLAGWWPWGAAAAGAKAANAAAIRTKQNRKTQKASRAASAVARSAHEWRDLDGRALPRAARNSVEAEDAMDLPD